MWFHESIYSSMIVEECLWLSRIKKFIKAWLCFEVCLNAKESFKGLKYSFQNLWFYSCFILSKISQTALQRRLRGAKEFEVRTLIFRIRARDAYLPRTGIADAHLRGLELVLSSLYHLPKIDTWVTTRKNKDLIYCSKIFIKLKYLCLLFKRFKNCCLETYHSLSSFTSLFKMFSTFQVEIMSSESESLLSVCLRVLSYYRTCLAILKLCLVGLLIVTDLDLKYWR